MSETYTCPVCDVEFEVQPSQELVRCQNPDCDEPLRIDRDAEFVEGMWRNRTVVVRLTTQPE